MFFILLGAKLVVGNLTDILGPALILSVFVLIGNPLIVMFLMKLLGFNKKTGFQAGLTVAQISEFSLILMLLGLKIGHVDVGTLSLVTIIGIITIALSTYMITYSDQFFHLLSPYLNFFNGKNPRAEVQTLGGYDVILFGCNRMGFDFIEAFKKLDRRFLAVDYDPEVVKELLDKGLNILYGDAEDGEFLEDINASEAKMIISTIPDYETTSYLLTKVRERNSDTKLILLSRSLDDALNLYANGADYVILPHFIGGQYVSRLVKDALFGAHNLEDTKKSQIKYLNYRKSLGHAKAFS